MLRLADLKISATKLRAQGKSYNDICRELGVAKSTLSYWFKSDRCSAAVKKQLIRQSQRRATRRLKLMARLNKQRWQTIYEQYRAQARREFTSLVGRPLFVTGIAIYWGEGDKRSQNSIVRVANTDPRLLAVFVAWLSRCCKVPREKIRIWLIIYPDHDERASINYWSRILKIPPKQFLKPYHGHGKEKRRKVQHGICTVQVYSRELKEKIIEWIGLHSKKLQSAGIV